MFSLNVYKLITMSVSIKKGLRWAEIKMVKIICIAP